jgi:hypothetical protein
MASEKEDRTAEQPAEGPKGDLVGKDYSQDPNLDRGGELDTGNSAIPPYEGRTQSTADSPHKSGSDEPDHVGGAAGPVDHEPMKSPEPSTTPAGASASPADKQPASEAPQTQPSDPGVGPAHQAGTMRAEDIKDRDGAEAGRKDTGVHPDDQADRPIGESSARDQSSIDPQEGNTDRQNG